ncbi:hypothetical protein FHS57_005146 [Runella defluvii]|uniref:Uncharacterized protein n=1 Tax=Runella defluvii TaxID=370973 RepID=A0A7W6ESV0_9BACT|nr:hypothetical protein [Runella defluvii]MBB3841125.1 hypothetical protein [Runella defluvii]
MALGKKSTNLPEIGDLVTVKVVRAFVFDDKDETGIPTDYPQNASLGVLQAIEENSEGKTMYQVDNGWIAADEVATKVNPKYSYPNTTTTTSGGSTTTKKDNSAFWTAISSIATGIFGIFGGKKTSTSGSSTTENTDTSEKDTGDGTNGGGTTKKTTPTWVYLTFGGVVVVGIIAALLWPKKKEPTPSPKPIVL